MKKKKKVGKMSNHRNFDEDTEPPQPDEVLAGNPGETPVPIFDIQLNMHPLGYPSYVRQAPSRFVPLGNNGANQSQVDRRYSSASQQSVSNGLTAPLGLNPNNMRITPNVRRVSHRSDYFFFPPDLAAMWNNIRDARDRILDENNLLAIQHIPQMYQYNNLWNNYAHGVQNNAPVSESYEEGSYEQNNTSNESYGETYFESYDAICGSYIPRSPGTNRTGCNSPIRYGPLSPHGSAYIPEGAAGLGLFDNDSPVPAVVNPTYDMELYRLTLAPFFPTAVRPPHGEPVPPPEDEPEQPAHPSPIVTQGLLPPTGLIQPLLSPGSISIPSAEGYTGLIHLPEKLEWFNGSIFDLPPNFPCVPLSPHSAAMYEQNVVSPSNVQNEFAEGDVPLTSPAQQNVNVEGNAGSPPHAQNTAPEGDLPITPTGQQDGNAEGATPVIAPVQHGLPGTASCPEIPPAGDEDQWEAPTTGERLPRPPRTTERENDDNGRCPLHHTV